MTLDADAVEAVRLAVYRGFATTGAEPSAAALAGAAGIDPQEVEAALVRLEDAHHVVRRDGRIVLAHPFGGRHLGFSVMGAETLWWGGCAWDAFAIPNLLHSGPVLVATTCPACGTPHAWTVDDVAPPVGDQVAHFLVPAAHIWDDVVHTCSHQRIFCSTGCVHAWLEREGLDEGSTFSLATLWRLASHWYDGRLDSPYVRREPAEAAAYFASVGLTGPFWDASARRVQAPPAAKRPSRL